jgi:adenine-specific DNA-methyltransferase
MPVGSYIVDFVCLQSNVVIELDGGQHAEQLDYDIARTQYLEKQGFRVIRYWNHQVLREIEVVLDDILRALEDHPHLDPLPEGEDGKGSLLCGNRAFTKSVAL